MNVTSPPQGGHGSAFVSVSTSEDSRRSSATPLLASPRIGGAAARAVSGLLWRSAPGGREQPPRRTEKRQSEAAVTGCVGRGVARRQKWVAVVRFWLFRRSTARQSRAAAGEQAATYPCIFVNKHQRRVARVLAMSISGLTLQQVVERALSEDDWLYIGPRPDGFTTLDVVKHLRRFPALTCFKAETRDDVRCKAISKYLAPFVDNGRLTKSDRPPPPNNWYIYRFHEVGSSFRLSLDLSRSRLALPAALSGFFASMRSGHASFVEILSLRNPVLGLGRCLHCDNN